MEKYTYELVLDTLNGCKWNCHGCTVDRLATYSYKPEDFRSLEEFMLKEKSKGSILNHFEIGPTDFLSCSNLEEILNDSSIQSLIKNFEHIFLTSTLLSKKDMQARMPLIKEKLLNKCVYLFIPLELKKLTDPRFKTNYSRMFITLWMK